MFRAGLATLESRHLRPRRHRWSNRPYSSVSQSSRSHCSRTPPFSSTRERAESVQNRIADRITAFAGSMKFVYLHLLWFGAWIIFGVEGYPYGLLTMIVSLEAIFLSTFVMISQNRADAKRSPARMRASATIVEPSPQEA